MEDFIEYKTPAGNEKLVFEPLNEAQYRVYFTGKLFLPFLNKSTF